VLGVAAVVVAAILVLNSGSSPSPPGRSAAASRHGATSHTRTSRTRARSAVPTHPLTWRIAWASAMAWVQPGVIADDVTVRELATVALGGRQVRVRISNLFGNAPLVVGAATVALSSGEASVVPATLTRLTFGGRPGMTIPVGQLAYSDPARLAIAGGRTLAVSLYVRDPDLITIHPYGNLGPVSFSTANGGGDQVDSASGSAFGYSSEWPRLVDAVDVLEYRGRGSIVVMGDSITDGFNATLRWTDLLQKRIDRLPVADRRAVINEGITANALNPLPGDDSTTGGGTAGLRRLRSDALGQAGVAYLVLFLGTNDLFFGADADQVIAGMRTVIERAHRAGIKVIGVTLLPRAGSERWDPAQYPEHQPYLEAVDRWIRTSRTFDGVLNLGDAVADDYDGQCEPAAMFGPYDSGDHLHPNAAGQTAMANAVDTRLFGLPQAPRLPPLVAVTPTPGCRG
jgi:lysophospholipase L1-like esterase